MEASASTREETAPPVSASAHETAHRRRDDRALALLFLGVVLTIYIVIGVAVYHLVAALF